MNSLIKAVAVAVALAAPIASFAQSSQPVTRAEVRAELVQLEKAGYNPSGDRVTYPNEIQAAETRVHAQDDVAQAAATGYGPEVNGKSQAGQRTERQVTSYSVPVYAHP
jgi:hypothetical protein